MLRRTNIGIIRLIVYPIIIFIILLVNYMEHHQQLHSHSILLLIEILLVALVVELILLNVMGSMQRLNKIRYKKLLNLSPDPAIIVDREMKLMVVNSNAVQLFGVSNKAELIGQPFIHLIADECKEEMLAIMGNFAQNIKPSSPHQLYETTLALPNGTRIRIEISITSFIDKSTTAYILFFHDLSKGEQYRKENAHMRQAIDASALVSVIDMAGTFQSVNAGYCRALKYTPEELIGQHYSIINSDYHPPSFHMEMVGTIFQGGVWKGEVNNCAQDGSTVWFDSTVIPFLDDKGAPLNFIVISFDVTARKEAESKLQDVNEKLLHLSRLDGLTGIANRRHFEETFQSHWGHALLYSKPLSVIMIDIDYFKLFNDTYGHVNGDKCLKEVAWTIQETVKPHHGFVARYGGEELVVLLPNHNENEALFIAEQIREAIMRLEIAHLESPISSYVTASAGIVTLDNHQFRSTVQLLNAADQALYLSKRDGRNKITVYQEEPNEWSRTLDQVIRSVKSKSIQNRFSDLYDYSYDTWEHCNRTAVLAAQLAEYMGFPAQFLHQIYVAGLVHDYGKRDISLTILNKPSRLTKEEFDTIKTHPTIGHAKLLQHDILKNYDLILQGVLSHHERWSGYGYPHGLEGEQIPVVARILSVVDAFDAMTTNRIYMRRRTNEEALQEIERCKGTQFDEEIATKFIEMCQQFILRESWFIDDMQVEKSEA